MSIITVNCCEDEIGEKDVGNCSFLMNTFTFNH